MPAVLAQLTTEGINVTAYYDIRAWSGTRSEILYAHSTVAAPARKAWAMNLDGTNKHEISSQTVNDPWGWSPDGTWIYFRRGTQGMARMNPDTGAIATVIPDIVKFGVTQIGTSVYVAGNIPAETDIIRTYVSTDAGVNFTAVATHAIVDDFTGLGNGFHRIRPSAWDATGTGALARLYYGRESAGNQGSYLFNNTVGTSGRFETANDIGHPMISHDGTELVGHFYVNCPDATPTMPCGYQYRWSMDDGAMIAQVAAPQWAGYTYRPYSPDDARLLMAKGMSGTVPDPTDTIAIYDITAGTNARTFSWPIAGGCGYWCQIVPEEVVLDTIIFRAGDNCGVPQIFSLVFTD